jgi:hypothetical protein
MLAHKSLENINLQSVSNTFALEDINWGHQLDRNGWWTPEVMTPWYYLPVYKKLDREIQVRYNQLFSLGLAEQFVWFEQCVVKAILAKIPKSSLPADLQEGISHFIEEEDKHTEMFWRILEKAEPEIYKTREFYLMDFSPVQTVFMHFIVNHPEIMPVWIWFTILLEERTMGYSILYHRHRKEVDSLFAQIHHLHLKDETRHVQMDVHFLKHFYEPQSVRQKKLTAYFLKKVVGNLRSPKRISKNIIRHLHLEFPNFSSQQADTILNEIPSLATNFDFQNVVMGRESIPRFHQVVDMYPEMHEIREILKSKTGC